MGQEKGRNREYTKMPDLSVGWWMGWMVMLSVNKDTEHLNNTTNDLIGVC